MTAIMCKLAHDGHHVQACDALVAEKFCRRKVHPLTRAAAQDVAEYGVRVNSIAPGAVDTPMHAHHRDYLFEYEKYIPLGRMQVAEDLVGPAVFLASDASSYMTGANLVVDGGWTAW